MKAKSIVEGLCTTRCVRMLSWKVALVATCALATGGGAGAQPLPPCPTGTTNCSNLFLGDVSTPSSAENTLTTSSQSGVSSASNASGNTISPNIDSRAQTTQNANNTTTGTISGGNTNSSATGGSATGNLSTNDNRSSVGNTSASNGPISNTNSTGPSTSNSNSGGNVLGSNSGGNTLSTGAATATNGPNTNTNRGGNTSSTNTNTARGGAGGAGGAGGSASSNGTNLGINGQQQGIDRSGNSANANTVNGGAQTSRSAQNASTRSGSNNAISVDAADRSATVFEGDRTILIPPIVPPTPPSTLAVGNIVKETTACGPLQQVLKTPINGKFFGLITSEDVPQGYTYDLAPVFDAGGNPVTYSEVPLADGSGYRLIGNQAIIFATVVGTSNARNLALGGGGSSGSWGQGGTGTSAANQQLVTNIQLKACDVGTVRRVIAMAPPLPIIPPPAE